MKYKPKSIKSTILIIVVVLALIFVARFFGIGTTRSAMRLGYIGNDASWQEWSASYLLLNGSLEHTIRPESNSNELNIEVKTTSGTLSLIIKDTEGNIVFEQENIETSSFDVEVPGEVRIYIKAEQHRGSFNIQS